MTDWTWGHSSSLMEPSAFRVAVFLGSGLEGGEVRFGLADRLAKKVDGVEVQLGKIEAEGL